MSGNGEHILSSHLQLLQRNAISENTKVNSMHMPERNSNIDGRRKLSLPMQVTAYEKRMDERRNSADAGGTLGCQGESLQLKTVQDNIKKGSLSKNHSLDLEKVDLFIPDAYLEAAMSPGSLREELKQIQTINLECESKDVFSDLFKDIEEFKIEQQ